MENNEIENEKDYQEMLNKYIHLKLNVSLGQDINNRLKVKKFRYDEEIARKNEKIRILKAEYDRLRNEYERLTSDPDKTEVNPEILKDIVLTEIDDANFDDYVKISEKKDKLEKLADDKIDEVITHTLKECPNCHSLNLQETGQKIEKDEKDYRISIINNRHEFIEYKCISCNQIVHEPIPNYLKEEVQYGSYLKSLVLALANIVNIPLNKVRKIISELLMTEINLSEGYLSKLQKQEGKELEKFVNELKINLLKSQVLYWDDILVSVNGKQGLMRYYGNDNIILYKAYEKKNKIDLDKDNILNSLNENAIVEHDYKVIYNSEYQSIKAINPQYLIKKLERVKKNIPKRTWCDEIIELFQKYNEQKNELIQKGINNFTQEEIDDFIINFSYSLKKGIEENENDESKPYYSEEELALIYNIIELRDNYIYWILDFSIPLVNDDLNEKPLKEIQSKMNVPGQFANIQKAVDYANIRSYIETCLLYGINEYDSLTHLIKGNHYTFAELNKMKNN